MGKAKQAESYEDALEQDKSVNVKDDLFLAQQGEWLYTGMKALKIVENDEKQYLADLQLLAGQINVFHQKIQLSYKVGLKDIVKKNIPDKEIEELIKEIEEAKTYEQLDSLSTGIITKLSTDDPKKQCNRLVRSVADARNDIDSVRKDLKNKFYNHEASTPTVDRLMRRTAFASIVRYEIPMTGGKPIDFDKKVQLVEVLENAYQEADGERKKELDKALLSMIEHPKKGLLPDFLHQELQTQAEKIGLAVDNKDPTQETKDKIRAKYKEISTKNSDKEDKDIYNKLFEADVVKQVGNSDKNYSAPKEGKEEILLDILTEVGKSGNKNTIDQIIREVQAKHAKQQPSAASNPPAPSKPKSPPPVPGKSSKPKNDTLQPAVIEENLSETSVKLKRRNTIRGKKTTAEAETESSKSDQKQAAGKKQPKADAGKDSPKPKKPFLEKFGIKKSSSKTEIEKTKKTRSWAEFIKESLIKPKEISK